MRNVILKDGTAVPQLGQGTWNLGERPGKRKDEIAALRLGIEHGMTLLDTAEMYGDGAAEELLGEAIEPFRREDLFIVSKVYPWNAGEDSIFDSCEASLERIGTDYLDMYLLHWRGSVPLAETVACMEELKKQGKILRWGVSNLDTNEMDELFAVPCGENCMTDQVLYHLGSRGIEFSLLPWLQEHNTAMMAYSPLAQAGTLRSSMLENKVLQEIASAHGVSIFQIMLAFTIVNEHIISIPRSSSPKHMLENRQAADIVLSADELAALNAEYPVPRHKVFLDMI